VAVSSGSSPTGRPAPVVRASSRPRGPTRRIARSSRWQVVEHSPWAVPIQRPKPRSPAFGGFAGGRCHPAWRFHGFATRNQKGAVGRRGRRISLALERPALVSLRPLASSVRRSPRCAGRWSPTTTRPRRSKSTPGSSLGSRGSIRETRAARPGFAVFGTVSEGAHSRYPSLADTSHTAPDRPPEIGHVEFDIQGLHLTSSIATPRPRVVVTDTLYGDFDLSGEGVANAVLP